MRWLLPAILVPFGIVYLVNALAPETQADANIYHLIPAIEVARTGALPGQISFLTSIAPIAIAMGVPIAPLAILVAVETIPDIVRTAGNVTLDVAVTSAVDRSQRTDESADS